MVPLDCKRIRLSKYSLLQHITPLSIGIEPREWKATTGYFWLILIPNFFLRAILGCDTLGCSF